MAVLLIECVPDCLEVELDDDGFVITVPAVEVDGHKIITLDCRLSPMPDFGEDCFEFSFGFTVSDLDGNEVSYFTQNRDEVVRYFGENTRAYVLPTVCACIKALVGVIQPNYIYRVTKGRNLPQKALKKHLLVTGTLLELGYSQTDTGTDEFGRTFCVMSR